jgi:hypothetical protein
VLFPAYADDDGTQWRLLAADLLFVAEGPGCSADTETFESGKIALQRRV